MGGGMGLSVGFKRFFHNSLTDIVVVHVYTTAGRKCA